MFHMSARWICCQNCPENNAPVFEKIFEIDNLPEKAMLRISGLGFYEAEINGRYADDALLQPAFSNYVKTVYYNEIDVTDLLKQGTNVIHVTLGNGWYNETVSNAWKFECAPWRGTPCLIAELLLNGKTVLVTDTSWKCAVSGWSYNSLRCGETFDARVRPAFDERAAIASPPGGILKKQEIEPIRVRKYLTPVTPFVHRPEVYDFGENLSGDVEIRVRGEAGAMVQIRCAEQILDNGALSFERIRAHVYSERFQTDEYILSGEGEEVWHSAFSYKGFRYASISVEKGKAEILDVRARLFHTDLPDAGGIETDNETVRAIHNACRRSTLTNFHHMPTDCPHREKNGWTGDGHIACEQALFNFDMRRAYEKWLDDIVDCQWPNGCIPAIAPTGIGFYRSCNGPTYDAVLFELPWQLYRFTGERHYLTKWYEAMKRYAAYMESLTDDGVSVRGLGDWCALDYSAWEGRKDLLTAYAAHIAGLYGKIARALSDAETEKNAQELEKRMRDAFNRHFGRNENEDMAYFSVVLRFRLTDDPEWALRKLIEVIEKSDFRMGGGILSAKNVLDALTENGRFDLAWRLASQREFPGWYSMVCLSGGGTLTESWSGGSSKNHPMFSEIGAWLYKALAGFIIDEEHPGFERVRLIPHTPHEIRYFQAWHRTPAGLLKSEWDEKTLTVTVPEGTVADFTYGTTTCVLTPGVHSFAREDS